MLCPKAHEHGRMPNSSQTEVLVVGAGPVGLLTALLLTRHGVRTRVIDEESRTAAHSYACALHPASLRLLERVGIADEVIELGRRVENVALFEGNERRAQLEERLQTAWDDFARGGPPSAFYGSAWIRLRNCARHMARAPVTRCSRRCGAPWRRACAQPRR